MRWRLDVARQRTLEPDWPAVAGSADPRSMPQAEVARQMRLSRGTVAKWWHRWCVEGEAGLVDRSSRPLRSPRRTDAGVEQRICRLRPAHSEGNDSTR